MTIATQEKQQMFYAGDLPWKGLGADVRDMDNIEDALVRANLDWDVALGDVWAGPRQELVKKRKAVYRTTDGRLLGITGGTGYKPIQNREMWAFMNSLLKDRILQLETFGQLKGGKKIWMLAKLDEDIEIAGDAHIPYLLGVTGHDLESSLMIFPTLVRVICQNTLMRAVQTQRAGYGPGKSQMIRVVHTGDPQGRMAMAKDVLKATTDQMRRYQKWLERAAQTDVTPEQVAQVQKTFIGTLDEATSTVRQNAIATFMAIYQAEQALHGSTEYSLIQAVTGYGDHSVRVRTKDASEHDERMLSTLWGSISGTKQKGLHAIAQVLRHEDDELEADE